jgi:hypothetical protein
MKTILSFFAAVALTLAACSKTTPHMPGVGGETNWLVRCSNDAACGKGACICGVCARDCSADRSCNGAFSGTCVGTASGVGKTLCAGQQTTTTARVCLPRCAAGADCGAGFDCVQAVCVPHVARDGGPTPPDAGPDGSVPDACSSAPDAACGGGAADPLLAKLAQSSSAWNDLVAAMGDTYSYAEENCRINVSGDQTVTTIQVENGSARLVTTTSIPKSQCLASVNRYADFQPRTLPELYDECKALVFREGSAVTIELDDRGVIRGCTWPGQAGCSDNCGEGFYLRAVTFGTLTVP